MALLMDKVWTNLHGQFVLRKSDYSQFPTGWRTYSREGWTLAVHPALAVTNILTETANQVGWLLGCAIDSSGIISAKEVIIARSGSDIEPFQFEQWLYSFGGRFAAVLFCSSGHRFYLDPGGTLAAVYSLEEAIIASTPSSLHWNDFEAYRGRMSRQPPLQPNRFFPAGLTGDDKIRRLLPNHYLDLGKWCVDRHWPCERLTRHTDADMPTRQIVQFVRQNIKGVTASYEAYIGLTAGRDSRMVLACARGLTEKVQFVTFEYDDELHQPDLHIASRIAKELRLNHRGVPLVDPDETDNEAYLHRIGWVGSAGKARDFDLACRRNLDLKRAWITGFGGEAGRSMYWRPGDSLTQPPTAEQMVERMRLPGERKYIDSVRSWYENAPYYDALSLLDLFYVEQRMGSWAAPHMYGAAPFRENITAFNHRKIFSAMMSLPAKLKIEKGLANAVMAAQWPELQRLPYQQFSGWRGVVTKMRRSFNGWRRRIKE